MSSSPTEIKRIIAFHLRNCEEDPDGPCHIKRFRLVNKEFSVIGAEFLLPVIHLTFQTKSFERLRTISQHPFYSQRVTHLQYEPDTFPQEYDNEEDWIMDTLNLKTTCDYEQRVKIQAKGKKGANFGYERSELREFYNAYRAVNEDQIKIQSQLDACNSSLMTQAIARLPNLTEITISFEGAIITSPNAFNRAYEGVLFPPIGDHCHNNPYGPMQLYSVLGGVVSAGIQLKTLKCGKISWRLLQMGENKIMIMKRAIQHLETLHIMLYAGGGCLKGHALEVEIEQGARFLGDYQMCEFLSAAQDLKTLSLNFDRHGGLELEYMVGTTTWTSLRVLELDYIIGEQDTLICLLQRHGGTLEELSLNNIVLLTGDWASAIPAIRKVVDLKDFRAVGIWTNHQPFKRWLIHTSQQPQELSHLPPCKLGMAMKEYMLGFETVCPLCDPGTYPAYPDWV